MTYGLRLSTVSMRLTDGTYSAHGLSQYGSIVTLGSTQLERAHQLLALRKRARDLLDKTHGY